MSPEAVGRAAERSIEVCSAVHANARAAETIGGYTWTYRINSDTAQFPLANGGGVVYNTRHDNYPTD